jgi:hypothetical protein
VATKQLLGFHTRGLLSTMRENDWINPFAATHTAPIDRTNFKPRLRHHEAAAAVAAVTMILLLSNGPF